MPSVRQILRLRSAWGTFVGLFCANYFWYFLVTWLPLYLVKERHYSMKRMAAVGSLAYFAIAGVTIVCGWLSDRWIREWRLSEPGAEDVRYLRPLLRDHHRGGRCDPGRARGDGSADSCLHVLWHVHLEQLGHHANTRRAGGCRAAGPAFRMASRTSPAS